VGFWVSGTGALEASGSILDWPLFSHCCIEEEVDRADPEQFKQAISR